MFDTFSMTGHGNFELQRMRELNELNTIYRDRPDSPRFIDIEYNRHVGTLFGTGGQATSGTRVNQFGLTDLKRIVHVQLPVTTNCTRRKRIAWIQDPNVATRVVDV
jgi:hypothetical protein